MDWTPRDGVRNKGRQRAKWADEIVSFMGGNAWHQAAMDRTKWRKIAEAFVQQWTDNG